MRQSLLLFLALLFPLLTSAESVISVGARSVQVNDIVLSIQKTPEYALVHAFLFAAKLETEARAKVLKTADSGIQEVARMTGAAPLMELQFSFKSDDSTCNDRSFLGYNAVFSRNPAIPFRIPQDNPLMFAFSKRPQSPASSIAAVGPFCALRAGSLFIAGVKGERIQHYTSPYEAPLRFAWNLDLRGILN